MLKNALIITVLAIIVAAPFVFRHHEPDAAWREGDPVIVVVSPHNEAIRSEFAGAFSRWHQKRFGQPVKVDWRNIGGTTEISRYLASEYTTSTRAWWIAQGRRWPGRATDELTGSRPPAEEDVRAVWDAYRATDAPDAISCKIDLFFGGGEYDHSAAYRSGFTVPIVGELPQALFQQNDIEIIPESVSGETWRTPSLMGNVLGTFGILYNIDRLHDLGIDAPPSQWADLADFRYFGQVGLADPTMSGSTAKAFEMLVHQQMHDAARAAGYSDEQIAAHEAAIDRYIRAQGSAYQRGDVPEALVDYQAALESGFEQGLLLIQRIGANARYFTGSSNKVPIDVSMGDATVGMAIDFLSRFQAEVARAPDGTERIRFVTPLGGTSVSSDPISLLRGAGGHERDAGRAVLARAVALRFIEFILSEEGQRVWCYAPGVRDAQGELLGPEKYALRRIPIARTFYPSEDPQIQAAHERHVAHAVDDLSDPSVNPYAVSSQFTYYRRWTGSHFSVLRDIVRAMCIDSGTELKAAWKRYNQLGSEAPGAERAPFGLLPTVTLENKAGSQAVPMNWRTAPDIRRDYESMDYMREWTRAFRDYYQGVAR